MPGAVRWAVLAVCLLLPIFYTVKPLGRESLRHRLLALAERAGARVLGAYEWGLAGKTKKANDVTNVRDLRRLLDDAVSTGKQIPYDKPLVTRLI